MLKNGQLNNRQSDKHRVAALQLKQEQYKIRYAQIRVKVKI